MGTTPPTLYVEGADDISVINALLFRHGLDTERGTKFLNIKSVGSVEELLLTMPDAIKASRERPVGFVLDIDIECANRWQAVQNRLRLLDAEPATFEAQIPPQCPASGYLGKVKGYQFPFGVWMMPDCQTDNQMLEDLLPTLIPKGDPLWDFAQESTLKARQIVEIKNSRISNSDEKWKCYSQKIVIKAQVRCWLAWQHEPGIGLGAAINSRILRHDSAEAVAFLKWLKALYNLQPLRIV